MDTKRIGKISLSALNTVPAAKGQKVLYEKLGKSLSSPRAHKVSITLNIWALLSFVITIAVLYKQAKRNREDLIERIEALKNFGRTDTKPKRNKSDS